jgi:hypothetical protein
MINLHYYNEKTGEYIGKIDAYSGLKIVTDDFNLGTTD